MKWAKRIFIILTISVVVCISALEVLLQLTDPYHLTIINNSNIVIENLVLSGQGLGKTESLGTIEPNQTLKYKFYTGPDGPLNYNATWNGKTHSGTIEGYLTGGFGGNGSVIFNKDGTITVKDNHTTNHPSNPP